MDTGVKHCYIVSDPLEILGTYCRAYLYLIGMVRIRMRCLTLYTTEYTMTMTLIKPIILILHGTNQKLFKKFMSDVWL